jgi:hypothetical protein
MEKNVMPAHLFTIDEMRQIILVSKGDLDIDDLPEDLLSKLYDYFLPDMPYGTAKARTGDPYEWIAGHLNELVQLYALHTR